MECHACRLEGHKIKECQTKRNIYIVNLKKTLRSKLKNKGRNAATWK